MLNIIFIMEHVASCFENKNCTTECIISCTVEYEYDCESNLSCCVILCKNDKVNIMVYHYIFAILIIILLFMIGVYLYMTKYRQKQLVKVASELDIEVVVDQQDRPITPTTEKILREGPDMCKCLNIWRIATEPYLDIPMSELNTLQFNIENNMPFKNIMAETFEEYIEVYKTRHKLFFELLSDVESDSYIQFNEMRNYLSGIIKEPYDKLFVYVTKKSKNELFSMNLYIDTINKEFSDKYGKNVRNSTTSIYLAYMYALYIKRAYDIFITSIAEHTQGQVHKCGLKKPLRCFEKMLNNYNEKTYEHLYCDKINDIVRGAIEYPSVKLLFKALKCIVTNKAIIVKKIKNTFEQTNSSGWRAINIIACFKKDSNEYLFEIQLRLTELICIKSSHKIYRILRFIEETIKAVHGVIPHTQMSSKSKRQIQKTNTMDFLQRNNCSKIIKPRTMSGTMTKTNIMDLLQHNNCSKIIKPRANSGTMTKTKVKIRM